MTCRNCHERPRYKDHSHFCQQCLNEYLRAHDRFNFNKGFVCKSELVHKKAKFLAKFKKKKVYEIVEAAIHHYYDHETADIARDIRRIEEYEETNSNSGT